MTPEQLERALWELDDRYLNEDTSGQSLKWFRAAAELGRKLGLEQAAAKVRRQADALDELPYATSLIADIRDLAKVKP